MTQLSPRKRDDLAELKKLSIHNINYSPGGVRRGQGFQFLPHFPGYFKFADSFLILRVVNGITPRVSPLPGSLLLPIDLVPRSVVYVAVSLLWVLLWWVMGCVVGWLMTWVLWILVHGVLWGLLTDVLWWLLTAVLGGLLDRVLVWGVLARGWLSTAAGVGAAHLKLLPLYGEALLPARTKLTILGEGGKKQHSVYLSAPNQTTYLNF